MAESSVCWLFGLLFGPEYGGNTFLQNVGDLPDNMQPHPVFLSVMVRTPAEVLYVTRFTNV
jgi:hypothetical protein